ncbi:hypothetical protein CJU90_2913 [Yarrowia sp. C11]|nr:hypothetical protein CKK34_4363 [Yarrowia sp. E02]KAG5369459.1 hypothetical protein CJU90_2913 [Yarrowia sp. C11]
MAKSRSRVEKPSGQRKTGTKEKPAKSVTIEAEPEGLGEKEKEETEVKEDTEEDTKEEEKKEEKEETEDQPNDKTSTPPLSENPDYIALTSALSMLTKQQETSRRDLVKLSQMRQQAVEQPEEFLEKVKSGHVAFPKGLYVTMVPSIDWNQYDFENRELDAAITRQKKESEKGVAEELPLFNQ